VAESWHENAKSGILRHQAACRACGLNPALTRIIRPGQILSNTQSIIDTASGHLADFPGRLFDIFNIAKPSDIEEAVSLARLYKIVSKISPLVGNLIEHDAVAFLNSFDDYGDEGTWIRQDPGFPDIIFRGNISPAPGFEVKAWYPFSTEITGRFRDSQKQFRENQTHLALLAWVPEKIVYGRPLLLDMAIIPGLALARARDRHYHNPPDYLVIEPEDTARRPGNLQQTNTSGYKFQQDREKLAEAQAIVNAWGKAAKDYRPTLQYQRKLHALMAQYRYRLDTNYAKIDRIAHAGVEAFKQSVLSTPLHGLTVREWLGILASGDKDAMADVIRRRLAI